MPKAEGEMISDEDLGELEGLEKRATDGSWRTSEDGNGPSVCSGNDVLFSSEIDPTVYRCDDELDGCPELARQADADCKLVVAARNALPALIAEVRRLRKWVADEDERTEARELQESFDRDFAPNDE